MATAICSDPIVRIYDKLNVISISEPGTDNERIIKFKCNEDVLWNVKRFYGIRDSFLRAFRYVREYYLLNGVECFKTMEVDMRKDYIDLIVIFHKGPYVIPVCDRIII